MNLQSRPVSRILSSRTCGRDDHLSRMRVAPHLQRPTRGSNETSSLFPPIWSCSGWGLPGSCCHQQDGELLPHPFTLTPEASGDVCFLWHFPRLTTGPRYGPPCSVEFGLSSCWSARQSARDHPACFGEYFVSLRSVPHHSRSGSHSIMRPQTSQRNNRFIIRISSPLCGGMREEHWLQAPSLRKATATPLRP